MDYFSLQEQNASIVGNKFAIQINKNRNQNFKYKFVTHHLVLSLENNQLIVKVWWEWVELGLCWNGHHSHKEPRNKRLECLKPRIDSATGDNFAFDPSSLHQHERMPALTKQCQHLPSNSKMRKDAYLNLFWK